MGCWGVRANPVRNPGLGWSMYPLAAAYPLAAICPLAATYPLQRITTNRCTICILLYNWKLIIV